MGAKSSVIFDPPATNRGVNYSVSLSIDWLSITFKDSKNLSYPQELTRESVECKPFNGYNLASRYSDGRVELIHTTRSNMGSHVVCSGDTLKMLPITPEALLKHVLGHKGNITRIDLAIDCKNTGLKPEDATERIKQGDCETLCRQFPVWSDPTTKGYTQYCGKKSSTAFVRIYNKAAEMGSDGEWTRVECSFGSKRAMEAGKKCILGADYRALVRGVVDFRNWQQWQEIMSVDAIKTNNPRTVSNTKRWLLASAAPSMARELYLDGNDEFYFKFIDTLRFFLDKLRTEETQEESA